VPRKTIDELLAEATPHELGYTEATDVIGGFEAWAADGLPVTRAGDSIG